MNPSRWSSILRKPLAILFACLALYLIIIYAPPYLTYYQIKQAFNTIVSKSSHLNDADFRKELRHSLESLNLPFQMDEVAITRVGDIVIIDVLYQVRIKHPFLGSQTLNFNPHIERKVSVTSPD